MSFGKACTGAWHEFFEIKVVERVATFAEKYQCKMSQIALAWQWA